MSQRFSAIAFYVTRRILAEWLDYNDHDLAEVSEFVHHRHMASRLGAWRSEHGPDPSEAPIENLEELAANSEPGSQ